MSLTYHLRQIVAIFARAVAGKADLWPSGQASTAFAYLMEAPGVSGEDRPRLERTDAARRHKLRLS